jgi:DNA-binding Xre family transcriptional regulator
MTGQARPRLISRLDQLMKEKDISGKELMRRAKVTERSVSTLRRNSAQLLDVCTVARICEALEVTPGELLDIEKEDS